MEKMAVDAVRSVERERRSGGHRHTRTRRFAGLVVTSVLATSLALVGTSSVAAAAPAPLIAPPAGMVSADALPTVQIDGVVWSQAVVGNTVYAGGRFNNARPANAAPGTQLTPRANLLAYNITTGNLITSFAPSLNGQVMSVTASPDGLRIYVVGDFTSANGTARSRVAAFSTATGQLITSFAPVGVTSQARAVVATNDTVYVGGGFQGAGGTQRRNLAAFRASDGALLPWNPNADYTVWALAIAADFSSVFAGGSFQNVGGQPKYGLAKINAATGALQPWSTQNTVYSAGPDAGITSLRVHNGHVYGTAWHFGPGGNLEGVFKAAVGSGDVEWVTDCHGDNYDVFWNNGIVYSVGHAHYCGNMGGGFPQYTTPSGANAWKYQHTQAWGDTAAGEILNDVYGYTNWHGFKPGPSMINWLPQMGIGSFTGQYQAGWSITGNADYVVVGGEFPTVNGVGQQGLVRFVRRDISPRQQAPRFTNNQILPTLVPTSPTSVRVSWLAGFDRDDLTLRYDVYRQGISTPRYTTNVNSNWWTMPSTGFIESGLTPGATYTYRIVVTDSSGNTVNGGNVSVTMPTSVPTTGHASRVRADGARIYWPLNEPAPAQPAQQRATDRAGVTDGWADTGVQWNRPGAVVGDPAARLSTTNELSRIYTQGIETAPDTFSAQVWIRAAAGARGRILGFSDLQVGNSGHRDRHIYMNNTGQLVFGVRSQNNQTRTIQTTRAYTDNLWHQVTATMSPAGMRLFVDGVQVVSRTDTTAGEAYLGFWRVGGDRLNGWPSAPSNFNFVGDVDEVAIYPTALSQSQIAAQFTAATAPPANQPPTATFTSSVSGLTASFNGSASSDPEGSTLTYAWNFGDGTTGSGATTSRTYAAAGTYTVRLTVTDAQGSSGFTERQVTVTAPPNQPPNASFTSSANLLTLSVDGSASTDPDGTIASHSWNWGDGTPAGSGATASHAYSAPGAYTVVLTVTDNGGATDTESRSITVAAANQPPVASFTSSASGLTLSVDGSGSTDPDGTVNAHSWNWGDGTPADTGPTATHAYGAPGSYTVVLTVTDDDGLQDTESRSVTVSNAPAAVALDTFSRTASNGWGTADVGGAWTVTNAPTLSVDGSAGRMTLSPGTGPSAYLASVSARDVDGLIDISYDKPATGGGIYQSFVVRRIGTSDYRLWLRITATNVTMSLIRTVNGAETTLATQVVPGLTYQGGQVLHLRLRATGAGTTTLQGKLWVDAQPEPATWNLTATDATAALQNPGAVGVYTYLSGSATNAPIIARFDELDVIPG